MKILIDIRRIYYFGLILLIHALMAANANCEELKNQKSINYFQFGSIKVSVPSSWIAKPRNQGSGRVLTDYDFFPGNEKTPGVSIQVCILSSLKIWKTKESFKNDYLGVVDLAKNKPQLLGGENYQIGLLEGNYLIELPHDINQRKTTSVIYYVLSNDYAGAIFYETKTKNGIDALGELRDLLSKQVKTH